MYSDADSEQIYSSDPPVEVILDGLPVAVPPQARSLAAIRFHLEVLALERHRFLCSLLVDGEPANIDRVPLNQARFARVEAESLDLEQMPIQLLETALEQFVQVRAHLLTAIPLVMINAGGAAREIWWSLASELKHPMLTFNLLPDSAFRPSGGCASVLQMRKWQLQQLAAVMKNVDEVCWSDDPAPLSDALEKRVLPWLMGLEGTLDWWRNTLAAAQNQPVSGAAIDQQSFHGRQQRTS